MLTPPSLSFVSELSKSLFLRYTAQLANFLLRLVLMRPSKQIRAPLYFFFHQAKTGTSLDCESLFVSYLDIVPHRLGSDYQVRRHLWLRSFDRTDKQFDYPLAGVQVGR
jgi:hypothetical protein